jgi:chemotaxis protein CheC
MTPREPDEVRAELDRLCELANVGAGHAAGALARLLGRPIVMDPPRVRLATRDAIAGAAFGVETTGIFFTIEGGIGGTLAILFPRRGRQALLEAILHDPDPHSEEAESALREVGNMLASHALSAVADLIGDRVLPSLPVLAEEAAGAVLESLQTHGDPVRIESRLVERSGALRSLLVWIPSHVTDDAAREPGL